MSNVYFTAKITPESVKELIDKAGIEKSIKEHDLCAVKMHFGEKNNTGYVKPELVKPVTKRLKQLGAHAFLTDANTIYTGQRSNAVNHLMLAYEHKFNPESMKCPVIIADGPAGNSYASVEVNLKHFKKTEIAHAVFSAHSLVCITHVKGHMGFGLGGAIKNIGMGCAARTGKFKLHSTVVPVVDTNTCVSCGRCIKNCPAGALTLKDKHSKIVMDTNKCIGCGECVAACNKNVFELQWNEETVNLQEKTVEYCSGALKDKRSFYISFLNRITKNCDCMGKDEPNLLDDIGIIASDDIVAIDQSSADLTNKAYGSDLFRHIWPSIDYTIQLSYAEKIGLGSRKYYLINI
ncbi:MAG: hypothetical protein A2252_06475 [Elusimicrobia bacterium RIFOXYA2_FULL_39_19]|nr:MAG: hypothetical protein A2252_06475 [Elusimicrobia bacterium RIFOXYA2_FULL_39_19]